MLVTFDAAPPSEAAARELPREYVPETFREWGVSLRDWQTQCSMRAEGGGGSDAFSLEYRVRRLLPSVGCEADATAFVDEAVVATASPASSSSPSGSERAHVLATAPDGGYALVPSKIPAAGGNDRGAIRVEACLPLDEAAPSGGRRRLRLVLVSSPRSSPSPPSLDAVDVHSETHDSDYCGGATLSGCGGSVPQFSSKERTAASELDGFTWAPVVAGADGASSETRSSRSFVFSRETSTLSPSTNPTPARKARGGPQGRLLLPLGSWASLRESAAPEGGVVFEAGVLLGRPGNDGGGVGGDAGRRRKVMTAVYSGTGDLTGVVLATEEAVGEA